MAEKGITPMSLEGNVAENWTTWRRRFENYMIASEMSKKDETIQCAQLLHYIGEDVFKIYTTFTIVEADKNKIAKLWNAFENYFIPKSNTTYQRYRFFTKKQENEPIEQYITELKQLAMKCNFGTLEDDLINTMIICGVKDSSTRQKLLQEDPKTLDKTKELCIIMEKARKECQVMECSIEVDAIMKKSATTRNPDTEGKLIKNCNNCSKTHAYNRCPAYGKVCNFCKLKNHFSIMCRKRKFNRRIHEIEVDENDEIDIENTNSSMYVGSVNAIGSTDHENHWFIKLKIHNSVVPFKIDTGSMVNILPLKMYEKIGCNKYHIKRTNIKLTAYTGDNLQVLGTKILNCKFQDKNSMILFYIVNSDTDAILSLKTSCELNLIKRINSIREESNYQNLLTNYKDVFKGIGCIKNIQHHITIDKNAVPIVHPIRKVALPLIDSLKESLIELENSNIIKKVQGPSEWVNALVLVRKPNGRLRVCLDPKDLNNAIKREHCQIPTLDEISGNLAGATIFSTLDANNGFYQIALDEESSDLCTFGTPLGRYKFLRLPYGIRSAPEVFQEIFKSLFAGEGTRVYIDDILIWGRNREEHDARLERVLKIARDNNVKFNLSKCKFGRTELQYMGHIISKNGIAPNNCIIKDILEIPQPSNKTEIQRLLGMLTYVSKFIPNFSSETQALRELVKKDNEFEWTNKQEMAFQNLKQMLTSKPVLQFFDVTKNVTVSVDASKSGLGAVLLQNRLPCAYASKAMTECQTRYAQIEKELLAICFGLERFHNYIFGKKITVETDHQPLISIFKKPLNKCPARLQRMMLQLQKYDIDLIYRPGKELILADALSRHYCKENKYHTDLDNEVKAQVCMVKYDINATPEKIAQFKEETDKDPILTQLKRVIYEGWPNSNANLDNDTRCVFSAYRR